MFFASAFFLWLLPLAALPVIFHLLLKRRQKRLAFPDLMFFLKADPMMHARRRLREILLLAARVLLLLLTVLALSRPVLRNVPAIGGRIALVIVVDNSASMDAATPAGESKLDLAREAARRLVDALDDDADAAIIPLVADPALEQSMSFTNDRDALNLQIARIRRTEARGSIAGAFARIRLLLDKVPAGTQRAVHIVSDLHTAAWNGVSGNGTPFDQTDIVVHRIPSARRHDANISLDSLTASQRVLLPGHACTVDVGIRNASAVPGDVRVNIRNNQDHLVSRRYTIAPGTVERVRYSFTPDEPGEYWVMADVEGDAFRGDNRAGMVLFCRDKATVGFIGAREHYGLMPMAVSPTGTGRHTALVPVFKSPEALFSAHTEAPPALLVGTWRQLHDLPASQSDALRQYITDGGRLLVVPDILAPAGEAIQAPPWLGIRPGSVVQAENDPVVGRILDPASGIWDGLHAAINSGRLRFFLMHRFAAFEAWPDYRLLAGITPRRPVLAERTMGQGRIYASGIAWDRQWTSLAIDPSGMAVIMLHNIAKGGLDTGAGKTMLDVVAGEPLPIPVTSAAPVAIRSLAGDTLKTSATSAPVLARAGAYRLEIAGRVYLVSVRGSPEEAADTFLDASDRLAVMGAMPHQVVNLSSSGPDIARHVNAHFTGRSLFVPIAMLVLLIWAVEAWLSTLHARPGRRLESSAAGASGGTG